MDEILVYGGYGHTGRFVIAELRRRGLTPVGSGRNPVALAALREAFPGLEVRAADVADGDALTAAVRGTAAVVNCAGPFLDTALPVAAAAVRAGAHYLDVTAEQGAAQAVLRAHAGTSDVAVIPAMAFYGGLPDLLATAASAEWTVVDDITVAIGLDRWWPTAGTRVTGRRNTGTRRVVSDGRLVPVPDRPPVREWDFPEPLGRQALVGMPFSEIITMSRHLDAAGIGTYLAQVALDDLHDAATPTPEAVDGTGRSAQRFVVDVVVRRGEEVRRASAAGRDIYAVTAPLVAEAVERLLDGRARVRGAAAPGEAFAAAEFLQALSPDHLTLSGTAAGPASRRRTPGSGRP